MSRTILAARSSQPRSLALTAIAPAHAADRPTDAAAAEVVVLRAVRPLTTARQLQRGFKVYREVCQVCHGLKLIVVPQSRRRSAIPRRRSRPIAAEYKVQDGPNDQGEMFERDGRPADRFPPPWPNENAARARYNGVPPDFSVIAKARTYERGFPWFIFDMFTQYQEQGVDYIHALLIGYEDKPPAGFTLPQGTFYNKYFPGHAIAMPPPLTDKPRRLHRRLAARRSISTPRTSPRS